MQHSIIVRIAWGLALFLVVIAAAFAWSATQRERHFESVAAAGRAPAAGGAAETPAGEPAGAAPATPTADADAIFARRCSRCHEPDEVPEWVATHAPAEREAALVEFLRTHTKATASDAEKRALAQHFAKAGG